MAAEKIFEMKIRKLLKQCGAWHLKTWSNGTQRTGVPDILCCIRGKFIGIEVKAATGRPSDLQLKELHDIDQAGGYAILLYPKDYKAFEALAKAVAANADPYVTDTKYDELASVWLEKYERMIKDDKD